MAVEELSKTFVEALKGRPRFFADLIRDNLDTDYRTVMLAWSDVRTNYEVERDEEGRYLITD